MGFPKIILLMSVVLFVGIGAAAIWKKRDPVSSTEKSHSELSMLPSRQVAISQPILQEGGELPMVDRTDQLFNPLSNPLPIVETLIYESAVPWLKGRPAWIGDYASYYSTSRHFIARSLNGKADYFTQKVALGHKFNVFRKDKNFQFYLLADLTQCKMALYYVDFDTDERVLLKTYPIGVGEKTSSGSLTPLGNFLLGEKIAVYQPGIMGVFQNQPIEMIRVFGTRWIPFEKKLEGNSFSPSKGLGIHGAPLSFDPTISRYIESREGIGSHTTKGSLLMTMEDIEELFSIVITKRAVIQIVQNSGQAQLPGIERGEKR